LPPPSGQDNSDGAWLDEKTLFFSNDGNYIVTSSTSSFSYCLWDLKTGNLIKSDLSYWDQIRMSPANNFIAFGSSIFNQKTRQFKTLPTDGNNSPAAVGFSYNDQFVAIAYPGVVYIFECGQFNKVATISSPDGNRVTKISFSDNNHFYVVSSSGLVNYVSIISTNRSPKL
jgi:WD40 repeat protein